MQIAGWYCSSGEEVVDRATLACALDRLTILSAGGDAGSPRLFARAEVKRTFCGQRSPILAATPEHGDKISAVPGLKLRGVKRARAHGPSFRQPPRGGPKSIVTARAEHAPRLPATHTGAGTGLRMARRPSRDPMRREIYVPIGDSP